MTDHRDWVEEEPWWKPGALVLDRVDDDDDWDDDEDEDWDEWDDEDEDDEDWDDEDDEDEEEWDNLFEARRSGSARVLTGVRDG